MGLWDEIVNVVTTGQFFSIPTIPLMIILFGIGLILGYILKKMLKVLVIVALLAIVAAYFGWLGLSFDKLKDAVAQYGPEVAQYAAFLIGALPIGLGFLVGFLLGFVLA